MGEGMGGLAAVLNQTAPWAQAWFQAALAGMSSPWTIVLVLVLTTFLLEDVAIAAGVALAAHGVISWPVSLAAVGGGIALGDVGLYAAGLGAHRVGWLRRRFIGDRSLRARDHLERRLPSAVLIARVVPGLRLLTYTACGFVRVPIGRFTVWVVVAVAMWTGALYALSVAVGAALVRWLGWPLPIAVALPIVVLAALIPLWRVVQRRRLQPVT